MSTLAFMVYYRAEHHCSGLGLPHGEVAHQLWLHIWEPLFWQMGLQPHTAHRSAQHSRSVQWQD